VSIKDLSNNYKNTKIKYDIALKLIIATISAVAQKLHIISEILYTYRWSINHGHFCNMSWRDYSYATKNSPPWNTQCMDGRQEHTQSL